MDELIADGVQLHGIYFDTFSEHYTDFTDFAYQVVMQLLHPDGVFSYFNGFAATNKFLFAVYQQIIDLDLQAMALECTATETIEVDLQAG